MENRLDTQESKVSVGMIVHCGINIDAVS